MLSRKTICPPLVMMMLLIACSHNYKHPESIDSKMARFQPKQTQVGLVPVLHTMSVPPEQSEHIMGQRSPASLSTGNEENIINPYQNKKGYFLGLLSQYEEFSQFSPNTAPSLESCPNFHSALLEHRETNAIGTNAKRSLPLNFSSNPQEWDESYMARFPQLSLPVTEENLTPTVADVIKRDGMQNAKEVLQTALDIHIIKTYRELKYLCETGVSDNYYIFENMIAHIQKNGPFSPSSQNMAYLIKTTIFSNMVILKSIKNSGQASRSIASSLDQYSYTQQLLQGLKLNWVSSYIRKVGK